MVKARTGVLVPFAVIVIAVGLFLWVALRVQPIQVPGHLVTQAPRVTVTDHMTGPWAQPAHASSMGSQALTPSVATKVGESQGVLAPQPTVAEPQQAAQVASSANNPCSRATKPAPMCPVAAP